MSITTLTRRAANKLCARQTACAAASAICFGAAARHIAASTQRFGATNKKRTVSGGSRPLFDFSIAVMPANKHGWKKPVSRIPIHRFAHPAGFPAHSRRRPPPPAILAALRAPPRSPRRRNNRPSRPRQAPARRCRAERRWWRPNSRQRCRAPRVSVPPRGSPPPLR